MNKIKSLAVGFAAGVTYAGLVMTLAGVTRAVINEVEKRTS